MIVERQPDILNVATPLAISNHDARRHLIESIAHLHGFSPADIRAPSSTPNAAARRLAYARFHAMHALREQFGDSYPRIAKLLGSRDHTTIIYGVRRWRELQEARA